MNVISPSHISVDNGFDTHGISSKYELCDDQEGGSCGGDEEEEDKISATSWFYYKKWI